jgi:hypothetical protein
MLEGRNIWYLIAALLMSGVLAAGISYWAANAYIAGSHSGDPLQSRGGLSPAQGVGQPK